MFGRTTTPTDAAPAPQRSLAEEVRALAQRATTEREGFDSQIETLEQRLSLARQSRAETAGIEQSLASMLGDQRTEQG